MDTDCLFVGIDSGTQGTKAVVFDEASGKVLAESYAGYPLIENHQGGREQDPGEWIAACRQVISEVLNETGVDRSKVVGIGVSGQQHGMVPLDQRGEVIRAAKLWCDTETVAQCETLTERLGGADAVYDLIGNHIAVGFTASKILWLKENEPDNYALLSKVLLPHDYINYWLTGEMVTEHGDASGTAYYDVRGRCWSEAVLNAIDGTGKLFDCLPELKDAHDSMGTVRDELISEFSLPEKVIVSSGGGDNMIAAIGTGNVIEGVVTASFGTSGTIYAHAEKPITDSGGELAAFCSSTGGWLPLICTMNCTVATEQVRELLQISVDELNELAMSATLGSEGVVLLPYFNGERTPALPDGKALLGGLTSLNFSRSNICRAAMEGATFGMRYGLDIIKRNKISPSEIRLVGGGAKSAFWRQLAADIFDCEVVCLVNEEAGAVGAAFQALWCAHSLAGDQITLAEITEKYVELDESTRAFPDSARVVKYQTLYTEYLRLNDAATTLYNK